MGRAGGDDGEGTGAGAGDVRAAVLRRVREAMVGVSGRTSSVVVGAAEERRDVERLDMITRVNDWLDHVMTLAVLSPCDECWKEEVVSVCCDVVR